MSRETVTRENLLHHAFLLHNKLSVAIASIEVVLAENADPVVKYMATEALEAFRSARIDILRLRQMISKWEGK